jgi:regulator of protease activity HflC (stomatin/prohibitin superfamily)
VKSTIVPILCLILVAAVCRAQTVAPAAAVTAIRAGKFIDVQTGRTLANQIILVRGAKVEAVGLSIKIPDDRSSGSNRLSHALG